MDDAEQVVVNGEEVVVTGQNVTIEYTEQTEYNQYDVLMQINENFVAGCGLISGLIGIIVGFECAKELLKIWLR